jgi:hypothetical protein
MLYGTLQLFECSNPCSGNIFINNNNIIKVYGKLPGTPYIGFPYRLPGEYSPRHIWEFPEI